MAEILAQVIAEAIRGGEAPQQTCMAFNCQSPAIWFVGAKLWARGFPRDLHPPAKMRSGVKVCDRHKENPGQTGEFFNREMRITIEAAFLKLGKATPDFDNAEWDFQLINPSN